MSGYLISYINNVISINDVKARSIDVPSNNNKGVLPTEAMLCKLVFRPMATNDVIKQNLDAIMPNSCTVGEKTEYELSAAMTK